MKKALIVLAIAILMALAFFAGNTCACEEKQCKKENAECTINESGKECCEGLTCVPFNPRSGNGKCTVEPTPTEVEPTPTEVEPTPTETEPTPTPVTREPAPGAPPEWSDPCFYLADSPDCKSKDEVFPGEGATFGPQK